MQSYLNITINIIMSVTIIANMFRFYVKPFLDINGLYRRKKACGKITFYIPYEV